MIPKPYIARWREIAPWNSFDQVEQDLVISRVLTTIFSDKVLRDHLAFRGGTALHKLYLHPAPRYSEDIDLVQIKPGPIGSIMKRINEVILFFEEKRITKVAGHGAKLWYRFRSEYEGISLKIKIEINGREHDSVYGLINYPFFVNNEWYQGSALIQTYDLNELLGTKLRALYQRRKGRDLFDLYYSRNHADIDLEKIVYCYHQYLSIYGNGPPLAKKFELNIKEKENSSGFIGDLEGLLRPDINYNQEMALIWLRENIIPKLQEFDNT